MVIKSAKAWIVNLDYNYFEKLKILADNSSFYKESFEWWKLKLKIIKDENCGLEGLYVYSFYIGFEHFNLHLIYNCCFKNDKKMMKWFKSNGLEYINEEIIDDIIKEIEYEYKRGNQ